MQFWCVCVYASAEILRLPILFVHIYVFCLKHSQLVVLLLFWCMMYCRSLSRQLFLAASTTVVPNHHWHIAAMPRFTDAMAAVQYSEWKSSRSYNNASLSRDSSILMLATATQSSLSQMAHLTLLWVVNPCLQCHLITPSLPVAFNMTSTLACVGISFDFS